MASILKTKKMSTPLVTTLQQIWKAPSASINNILMKYRISPSSNTLLNKVTLAKRCSKSRQLTPEDQRVAEHPKFE
jgi:hypothetical protein